MQYDDRYFYSEVGPTEINGIYSLVSVFRIAVLIYKDSVCSNNFGRQIIVTSERRLKLKQSSPKQVYSEVNLTVLPDSCAHKTAIHNWLTATKSGPGMFMKAI